MILPVRLFLDVLFKLEKFPFVFRVDVEFCVCAAEVSTDVDFCKKNFFFFSLNIIMRFFSLGFNMVDNID